MATLTANTPRRPDFCDHKLPTSCRLTATPLCCACADRRAHSPSYSIYIDGIGSVLRGKRWDKYCWFCKEFWNARLAATDPPLRPGQTRIPEHPDQSDFLEKWYDFHRGYRIIKHADGTEEREAVRGEPLGDVAPGHLPRTLEQLRDAEDDQPTSTNVANTQQQNTIAQSLQAQALPSTRQEEPIWITFDLPEIAPPASTTQMQRRPLAGLSQERAERRIAALRRELARMRNGIDRVVTGLRELGETVPGYHVTESGTVTLESRLRTMERNLTASNDASEGDASRRVEAASRNATIGSRNNSTTLQERLEEASAALREARRARESAANDLEASEEEVRAARERSQQVEREMRQVENFTRVFGTREDIERQGADYESPIGGMFNRAWGRYRQREEERRQESMLREVLEAESRIIDGEAFGNPPTDSITQPAVHHNVISDHLSHSPTRVADIRAPHSAIQRYSNPINSDAPDDITAGPSNTLSRLRGLARELRRDEELLSTVRSITRQTEPLPHPFGIPIDDQEQALHEYYATLRNRGWAQAAGSDPNSSSQPSLPPQTNLQADQQRLERFRILRQHVNRLGEAAARLEHPPPVEEEAHQGLDLEDDGRPEPMEADSMTVLLECKICYTQMADTAVLPCGHMVMCQWCAKQQIPTLPLDKTRPSRPSNCPLCRKRVKQKVRIYRA